MIFFSAASVGFSVSGAGEPSGDDAAAEDAAAVAAGGGVDVGEGNIFGKNSRSCGSNSCASSGEENSIAIRNCGSFARTGQAANTIRELVRVSAWALANFTSDLNSLGGAASFMIGSRM